MRLFRAIFVAVLLPATSMAMEWSTNSWVWDSAELLRVGQTHVSLTHQIRNADERLNSEGKPEILGRSRRQTTKRGGETLIRDFEIEMKYERWTPTWAYGLSRNWTLMAMLPMTKLRSNITERVFSRSRDTLDASTASEAVKSFQEKSGVQIAEAGEYRNMRVGRFELRSKHRVFESSKYAATLFETLKFPTLEKTQVDFVAFTDPLPQNFGTGLGLLFSAEISRRWDLLLSSEYLYQLPDKVYGRHFDGSPTKEVVGRKPGAETLSKLGASYEPKEHLSVTAGYSYQDKAADEYKTPTVEEGEIAEKHSVYVGLAYLSGLRSSKRIGQSGFSASLGYEALLEGLNVQDTDTLSLEMQMTY